VPYCTNCGEEVTDEQRYCSYCGEPVGEKPEGGHDHRRDASAGRDRRARQPRQQRQSRGSEARGERAATDRRQEGWQGEPPEADLLPRRGTFETYYDGLRESVGLPLVLGLLLIAWALTALPSVVPASVGFLLFLCSAAVGLLGAGVAYVYTDYSYRDEDVTAGAALGQTVDRALALLGIWLVFVVAFSVGFSLLVIPGLYVGGRLLLAFPACVLDGEGVRESLSTSWELTRGDSLKPMGFLVAMFVTAIALSIVMAIPQSIVYSALDLGVNDAQTIEELVELASDPQFAAVNAVFSGLTMMLPAAAVQIAAAKMYLEKRYGVREKLV